MRAGTEPAKPRSVQRMARRQRERQEAWITLYLPPVCKGDYMAVKHLNVESRRDMEEWDWWRNAYAGTLPPSTDYATGG